jgi:hypothetical protein
MDIKVNVEVAELDLDTVLGSHYDEDGDRVASGTLADLIATKITDRAAKDSYYKDFHSRVQQLRDEEIRAQLAPLIAEAIAKPLRTTNSFGESTGPETTLRELILAEVRKVATEPVDRYGRNKAPALEVAIRKQVEAAFGTQIAQAVKDVKDAVAGQLSVMVADAVAKAR